MPFQLERRVALVTGSGRNLGREISLTLAACGCDIVVNARANEGEAEAVRDEIETMGRNAIALVADVSQPDAVVRMVDSARDRFGRIDILVNNAAIRPYSSLSETSDSLWRQVLEVNLFGPFYCSRTVAPMMIANRYGCIINVSGTAAFSGLASGTAVVASKAGLRGLTKALALELGPHGIRVNTVVPGSIGPEYASESDLSLSIPLSRPATMRDVANACAFLASEMAASITGQDIHVNAGSFIS